MLVIILAMIVIAVCVALLIFIIRYVIYVFTPEKEVYYPFDEYSDDDMKTYREWFSLDIDKRNLTMTKEEWIKNSNEEVISKAEYLRRKSAYYGQK